MEDKITHTHTQIKLDRKLFFFFFIAFLREKQESSGSGRRPGLLFTVMVSVSKLSNHPGS